MRRYVRRQELLAFITVVMILLLYSCTTAASVSVGESLQFSLVPESRGEASIGLLMGTVHHGAGFFFPSDSDILDISLLRTDPLTGAVTEISHQRIRNILKFPVQFTVRFDEAEIPEGSVCSLVVTLTVQNQVRGQGSCQLKRSQSGFETAELTLLNI